MSERTRHLDLLADHVVERMHALCKEAVQEGIGRHEAAKVLGMKPMPGDMNYGLDQLRYADDLLYDVIAYIQSTWVRFRSVESQEKPIAPTFDDDGDFEG